MGKTKKKYQAKRVLALILAVTMVVGMAPSTVYAAPEDISEQTEPGSTATVETDDGNQETSPEDTDKPAEDVNEPVEGTDEGSVPVAGAEEMDTAGGKTEDAAGADDATNDGPTEDKEDVGGSNQTMAAEESQAKPVYEFIVDGLNTTSVYTGSYEFNLSSIQLAKKENGQTVKQPAIGTAGVTYIWKMKGADDAFSAMANGAEPINAGNYELELTYAKQEGVHDGAQKTVAFEIKKAPVTAAIPSVSFKPGTTAKEVKETVKFDPVYSVYSGESDGVDPQDLNLKVATVKDAVTGVVLKDEDKLKKDGDYALDVEPSFTTAAAAKDANYELPKKFTVDIEVGNLISTEIKVTYAKKGEEEQTVIKRTYDGKSVKAPESSESLTEYTAEVWYTDSDGSEKKLEGAKITGKWVEYDSEIEDYIEITDPVDADYYTYRLTYTDSNGVYADSDAYIDVEVEPATVKVEIANKEEKLEFPEKTALQDVLSRVTYDVKDETGKSIKGEILKKQIWGTSYSDSNASQIYEPLFTLEVKNGTTYESIEDADYELESGKEYRVVFAGKKAIYNADGTCAYRTDINNEDVNGYDNNYTTSTDRTNEKTLAVEVKKATKAVIDVDKLVDAENASKLDQIGTLKSKEYDGKEIYSAHSQYRNKVSLKSADGAPLKSVAKEFSYEWQVNDTAENLQDKANLENEDNWYSVEEDFTISPSFAGIYRLEISYQDMTDDGTLYYVEKPEYVYYAIDTKKVKVVIDAKATYETLSGYMVWQFFQKNDIAYKLQEAEGEKEVVIPAGQYKSVTWKVIETVTQNTGDPQINEYFEYDDNIFESDSKYSYQIQADYLDVYGGWTDYSSNYTLVSSDKKTLTVKPMGTAQLSLEVETSKWADKAKVYDGKPFAEKDLIADGLVKAKKEDGTEVSKLDITYIGYNSEEGESELKYITEAGEYELYACFGGSEDYAPYNNPNTNEPVKWGKKLGKFTITQREVTLKVANLPETYTAGVTAREILSSIPGNVRVEGYAPDDEWAFTEHEEEENEEYYILAWSSSNDYWSWKEPAFQIYEKGKKEPVTGSTKLSRDKAFEVRYNAGSGDLVDSFYTDEGDIIDFARNYKVAVGTAAEFSTVKGNSTIKSVDSYGIDELAINVAVDDKDKMKQEVTFLEGIPYYSEIYLDDGTELEGNLAAFTITAPKEYDGYKPSTAMYRNEIEKQGGYIVEDYPYDKKVTFVFDANKGTKTFKVRWEDDYVETFVLNFDTAAKLGNLDEAVAPKSLAFNAPNTKMAVGESQQLDVKITKAQMGDIICLGYKSSDEKTLIVDEYGYVTALKEGKANIEVFPLHKVKGKLERIKDAKGNDAKGATVAINVTKMSAPKTVKVVAHGTFAYLYYDIPADGYRREIYVVDNTKYPTLKNERTIEEKVKSMKENQWQDTFAIEPIYQDSADEAYNMRRNNYTALLSKLETTGTYTVYVRNVCAARKLADGSVITKETVDASAAGKTVSFKTLKSEMLDLHLTMNEDPEGITDLGPGYYGHEYRIELGKLNKGTVESMSFGRYLMHEKDPNADTSKVNYRYIQVPLKEKTDKQYYEDAKLEYTLSDCYGYDKKADEEGYGQKNAYASIDKKGKIKITGVTTDDWCIMVRVRDTVTGNTAYAELYIVAEADSVTAKKKSVSMTPGQEEWLGNLLTYKVGKQTLTAYSGSELDLDAVRSAIKDQGQEKFFEVDRWGYLKAIGAKGGNLTLNLTDKNVAKIARDKATATIKFTTGDLAPVKKLKAFDVINDSFGLTFTHPGGAEKFLVEISDGSRLLYSMRYDADSCADDYNYGKQEQAYTIWPYEISARLSKESSYTVTVTAQYDGIASKSASAKVKTTQIPAVSGYISDDYYDDEDNTRKHRGGMSLQVSEWDSGCELSEEYGTTTLRVLSGNSYTLTANVEYNRGRVYDTLIWTVDDAKVASVKAAAGTYCITLKGLKPGSTVLEVKSKIWGNKVIARYDIEVVAVRDAYSYYGDNEPGGYSYPSSGNDDDNTITYLPISVGYKRKVAVGETEYFRFTASKAGKYRFSSISNGILVKFGQSKYGVPRPNYNYGIDLGWLEEGESVNLCSLASANSNASSYYVEVTGQQVENLVAGQKITGQGREEYIKFTAPATARYQFSLTDQGNSKKYLYLYDSEYALINSYSSVASGYQVAYPYPIQEGDAIWLKTDYLYSGQYTFHAEQISQTVDLTTPTGVTVAANGGKQYLTYTVGQAGYYEFVSAEASSNPDVDVTVQINGYNYSLGSRHELQAGDIVELIIENYGSSDVTLTIQAKEVQIQTVTEGTPIAAEDGGVYAFTAATAGTYEFSMSNSNCVVSLYDSASDAFNNNGYTREGGSGPLLEREMTVGQTVWMATSLYGESECNLSVNKISQDMELGETGTEVTVEAGKRQYLSFAVPKDGYYQIKGIETSDDASIDINLFVNGEYDSSDSMTNFSFRKNLKKDDLVRLEITGYSASTLTVQVIEIEIPEIPSEAISLDNSYENAYKFTASEGGLYRFLMEESEDVDISLYLYSDMEEIWDSYGNDYYALASTLTRQEKYEKDEDGNDKTDEEGNKTVVSYYCEIDILLNAGQTVYVNPRTSAESAEVTLSAGKLEEEHQWNGNEVSLTVNQGETTQVTYTAQKSGIYTFSLSDVGAEISLSASTVYENNGARKFSKDISSGETMEQPLVLAAGQPILWTIAINDNDTQTITMNASLTKELKEIKVGETLQATISPSTADGFVFKAPKAGDYAFWSESNIDTYGMLFAFDQVDPEACLSHNGRNGMCLRSADSGGINSDDFKLSYQLKAGETVYLKAMDYYGNDSATFDVSVEEVYY